MAFQQPQRLPTNRQSHSPAVATPLVTSLQESAVERSQEWVLFSAGGASTAHDQSESTRTPRTAGQSRLSDIGSLETAAISEKEQDDDLDSLDDGLHAFHEPLTATPSHEEIQQSALTVLPTHDGLGTFPGNSSPVQEQIWQHERYNPRRRRQSTLRRSSIQKRAEALELEGEPRDADEEKRQRIEKWRLDQSKAILDEIEKETRRMLRRGRHSDTQKLKERHDPAGPSAARSKVKSQENKPIPVPTMTAPEPPSEPESLWERFKRRVIRDLMGIDDATLCYIFGEALPTDAEQSNLFLLDRERLADRTKPDELAIARSSDHWQERLLARISRELGILLHQLSEHPGAFSAYLSIQEEPPYAGLRTSEKPKIDARLTSAREKKADRSMNMAHPRFSPTINTRTHKAPARRASGAATDASLWGIEEEEGDDNHLPSAAFTHQDSHLQSAARLQHERQYWERDLDMKMVFGYLRSRLTSSSSPSPPNNSDSVPDPAAALVSNIDASTVKNSDSLRRAALIRHHHPLVSRNNHKNNRPDRSAAHHRSNSNLSAPLSPILGRRDSTSFMDDAESSCASQSTKKSKTMHSGSLRSSNNYWDLGAGSLSSSGAAWSAGWGEV